MSSFSLTASIPAIVGVGTTVGKALKRISSRGIPDILLQLNNEVSDLQYVVQAVDDVPQ